MAYTPVTLQEKNFYELFKFPLDDAYWALTDIIEDFKKDHHGLFTDSVLTEKGQLFIKWYSENYLSALVEIIDIYIKKNKNFFYAYKHIIFTPETIPTILSISNRPKTISKFLSQ